MSDLFSPSRNLTSTESFCESLFSCRACSSSYPTCAWCASSNTCLPATQQLQQADDSTLVYKLDEYTASYGVDDSSAFHITDGTCAVWFKGPADNRAMACDLEQEWQRECASHDEAGCPTCLSQRGCGMCVRGNSASCRAGSKSSAWGSVQSQHMCDGPEESWIFGDHANGRFAEECVVSRCPSQGAVLATGQGLIGIGSRDASTFYEGGMNCSWVVWPSYGNRTSERATIKTTIRTLDDHDSDSRDTLAAYVWQEGVHPVHAILPDNPGDWPRSTRLATIGDGGARSMDIKTTNPVILDFKSFNPAARAVVEISWEEPFTSSSGAEEDSFWNVASSWLLISLLLAGMMITVATAMLVRKMALRRLARQRRNSEQREMSIEDIVQKVPTLRPKAVSQQDLDAASGTLTCSVCLVDLAVGDSVRNLPCTHRFHMECIDTWLQKTQACPLCRRSLGIEEEAEKDGAQAATAGGRNRAQDLIFSAMARTRRAVQGNQAAEVAPAVIGAQQSPAVGAADDEEAAEGRDHPGEASPAVPSSVEVVENQLPIDVVEEPQEPPDSPGRFTLSV
mmetsp:Transcript_75547/g.179484  ORF Transcript_75547/g.179484 Transcript_75547/m.179484 type:complete len:566 (-) Transcript_75547:155-1852(-)|eukprot:CAMPEP_0178408710 /NCGR_PEP_ID=MMETSP0689_2-20121128/20083_1 /TAXON_ID=160604 /ORGANISM="Amphidinium massartii, Strain CS-259" /LENGTH=565 /DNA_ID=CAMNT_0020029821 /DNA_START=80 /DNA_END=1777 /DNA_ORIENTATION=+